MERTLSDALFAKFSNLVYETCGINLHDGKKALLQARLSKRLRLTGFTSFEDYYNHIRSPENARELTDFMDAVSTNLTYFFREPQHFNLLEDRLINEMLERKSKQRNSRIRIWSAGCSTGEEPYSLAMCVLPHLKEGERWDFMILATDISTRVLNVAVKGVYPPERVQKVPPALRQRYFRKTQNGRSDYEVVPHLKDVVTVRYLNLKGSFPFKGLFDFIFCRNVMIYFDKATQGTLIRKMINYLEPGGHLFIGHSESLAGLEHALTYVQPAVYRK